MSVQSIYMDDGVTETDDFKTLWQCLESEIEHYEDILKAKLVSLLLHLFNYPLATAVSLLCNWLTITCNCRQFTCNWPTIHLQLLPAYFAIGQLFFTFTSAPTLQVICEPPLFCCCFFTMLLQLFCKLFAIGGLVSFFSYRYSCLHAQGNTTLCTASISYTIVLIFWTQLTTFGATPLLKLATVRSTTRYQS